MYKLEKTDTHLAHNFLMMLCEYLIYMVENVPKNTLKQNYSI